MKRILIGLMAILLVVGMLGAGTSAYFSSTVSSTSNDFSTGTLTAKVSNTNNGTDWADSVTATWDSPAGWAPGQTVEATLYLKNAGDIDALVVYENWNNLVDSTGLANKIQVLEIRDSYPCPITDGCNGGAYGDNFVPNFLTGVGGPDANGDDVLTLAELASWGDRKVHSSSPQPWDVTVSSTATPGVPPVLPKDGTSLGIRYKFKLMEDTDNSYQGAICTIDLTLLASQNVLPPI